MNFYELLFNRGQPSGEGMTHFERLFAAKLAGGGEIKELEGVPPLLFNADGSPLISWTIYGNMQQATTPTPTNPVTPNECGERTAQLLNTSDMIYGTWTGSFGGKNSAKYAARTQNLPAVPSLAVSVNSETIPFSYSIIWVDSNDTFIRRDHIGIKTEISLPQTFTAPNNAVYYYMQISCGSTQSDIMTKEILDSYKIMLNTGSTALPYEPYGYKLPVISGGTTTPIYLGEVQSERKIKKLVFDGTETGWRKAANDNVYYVALEPEPNNSNDITTMCSHYAGQQNVNAASAMNNNGCAIRRGYAFLYIRDDNYTDLTNFKTFLQQQYAAGTPVCVWYVLATPQTTTLNEPIRKIGDYADSVSDVVEIPTTAGSQTFDVDTTLKPSNVYIKYKT